MQNPRPTYEPQVTANSDDVRQLVRRLEAVNEASLTINSELSLGWVLQKIVDLAREIAAARYAALGVPDNRGGMAQFVTSGMSTQEIAAMDHPPRGLGLLGALLSEPRSLRIKNIREDPRSIGFPPHHPPMKSFLGVPIISKGRILGNFYLTEKIDADEFSEEDQKIIEMLAAHAAVAIDNANLYGQTDEKLRQKVSELERSERRARFMAEVSTILTDSLDVQPILDEVALRSTEVLGDAAGILLIEEEDASPGLVSLHHLDPARGNAAEAFLRRTAPFLTERAMRREEYILVSRDTVLPDEEIAAVLGPALAAERFSACIAVPLRARQAVYGIFVSLATQPRQLSENDFALTSILAERMGVALENSRLFSQLKRALGLRDQFISIASHELKTPVTSLKIAAQLAQRTVAKKAESYELGGLSQQIQTLVKQTDRLAKLANDLLDATRIEAGRLELYRERMDLVRLAGEIVARFAIEAAATGKNTIRLEAPEAAVWGSWDAGRIEQVLVNLLSNAIKYSPSGGEIVVKIDPRGGNAYVSVSDQGVGIPRDQLSTVFEAYQRARNVGGGRMPGLGLGLHITKEIVERHGGRIWAESAEGTGTTMHFTLPVV